MSILNIVKYPAEVLEQKCDSVTVFDKRLVRLITNMYDTMLEADGVGLAAPQIGIAKRIAIVEADEKYGKIEMINPEIIELAGEQTGPEGCLSFPGLYGEVSRPNYVKIRAQNRKGKWYELEAKGFLARAIQHEMDHLNGVLFTSKVIRYYEENELEVEG
ncbi:peptide deformylase [Sutcliffiella rhizosphaerae]|uniref:Peptide deformylase n=1 Tax=Sutcliffiella rhizosphaerae TaxID=2880967 RepID=A0ABM8YIN6_9BACI|nr:peptide deformylase [Sutcliffiella rhizosphaerae]CAG9619760.1 Peptide deformylase 1 [Sutcliffiella rhizosphaerae]